MLPQLHLLQPNITKYFHTWSILNYHYFLSTENILNLNEKTNAVLAEYCGTTYSLLLKIEYQNEADAKSAEKRFVNAYIPESKGSGALQMENGKWTMADRHRNFLVIVLESPSKETATGLIQKVKENLVL